MAIMRNLREKDVPKTMYKKTYFISYTTRTENDKKWAIWVEWVLKNYLGHNTIMQEYDFRPGDNFIKLMEKAVAEADYVIGILTNTYLRSTNCEREWTNAYAMDKFIPIKFDDCTPRGLLNTTIYIDLCGLSRDASKNILVNKLQGTQRPLSEPDYPGENEPDMPNFLHEAFRKQNSVSTASHSECEIPLETFYNTGTLYGKIIEPGSLIPFGNYYWHVFYIYDNSAFITTKNIVELRPYHNNCYDAVTWEQCDLRKYLNGKFYYAFSQEERKRILKVRNINPDHKRGRKGGNDTYDNIFLLSANEADGLSMSFSKLAYIRSSAPAVFGDSDKFVDHKPFKATYNGENVRWWLRSPGEEYDAALYFYDGWVYFGEGSYVDDVIGVRPALWIKCDNWNAG